MTVHPFFGLPRTIQDRFIAATRGHGSPRPLLVKHAWPRIPYRWLAASCVFGALFVMLLAWDYGRLDGTLALMPRWMLVLYGVSLASAGFCACRAAALWWEERQLPFRRGRYLFPIGLIDATTDQLVLRRLDELVSVEVTAPGRLSLRFADGAQERFEEPRALEVEHCREAVAEAKARLEQLLEENAQPDLRAFDPLEEPRFSNPLAPPAPWRRPASSWAHIAPYTAASLGLLLGVLLGSARNKLSERSLYVAAVERNDAAAYQAYLARGGQRTEVREWLLPHAELEALVARGDLTELQGFYERHQASAVRPAIERALRHALLTALDRVIAAGRMSQLDEFESSHASYALVQDELRQARHALMDGLQRQFIAEHASADEALRPFSRRLLRHLATQSRREVTVRFVRVVPESVAKADEAARRDRYFAAVMLPSRYFDAEHSERRERAIFEQLEKRFERAFPPDALKLVLGQPLLRDEIPESAERPTLFISHSANMGGGIRNLNPHGTFFGVGFLFRAQFVIPGEAPALSMRYSTWKPPDLLRLRQGRITIAQVYLRMADEAFGSFQSRLVHWLFAE